MQTRNWINSIKQADDSIYYILVGNKCDLPHEVTSEEIEEFQQRFNVFYFETSAKDNTNVQEAFDFLGVQSYRHHFKDIQVVTQKLPVKIGKSANKKKKKNNC